MIAVSVLALIAILICLYLLQNSKREEEHMKAIMIFTSNDLIINTGVIVAGILELLIQSKYHDLIIGVIVFLIVITDIKQEEIEVVGSKLLFWKTLKWIKI